MFLIWSIILLKLKQQPHHKQICIPSCYTFVCCLQMYLYMYMYKCCHMQDITASLAWIVPVLDPTTAPSTARVRAKPCTQASAACAHWVTTALSPHPALCPVKPAATPTERAWRCAACVPTASTVWPTRPTSSVSAVPQVSVTAVVTGPSYQTVHIFKKQYRGISGNICARSWLLRS